MAKQAQGTQASGGGWFLGRGGGRAGAVAAWPVSVAGRSFNFVKETISEFLEDDCMTLAAALAFYTMFSLAPMLIIVIRLVGLVADPQDVQQTVHTQVEDFVGPEAAEQVDVMIESTFRPGEGLLATVLSTAAIVVGATGVLAMLQTALNKVWDVAPRATGIAGVLIKRALSFVLILGIAALLFLMLIMTTVISAFGDIIGQHLAEGYTGALLMALQYGLSFVVMTVLVAAVYALMPDADIRWRDVWTGAAVTAGLFVVGNFLLGLYFAYGTVGTVYGAAGSLAVILIWVYYGSMIVLLGAEFTHVWTRRYRQGAD